MVAANVTLRTHKQLSRCISKKQRKKENNARKTGVCNLIDLHLHVYFACSIIIVNDLPIDQ